jgi:CRP-like cAMP-binding protein
MDRAARAQVWDEAGKAAFLRRVRLFEGLSDAVRRDIATRLQVRQAKRDSVVFRAGRPADSLNLLADGRVKVIRETEDGREVILRVIGPGEIFGGAGVWGEPVFPATAVAVEDAVVLRIAAVDFAALLAEHPSLSLAVIRELGARLREAENRIRELQTERVERRIARVLLRLANKTGVKTADGIEIGVPLSRQELADLVGSTLSTVSRTLSAWDQQGYVAAGRERVVILKPHRLVAIADELA